MKASPASNMTSSAHRYIWCTTWPTILPTGSICPRNSKNEATTTPDNNKQRKRQHRQRWHWKKLPTNEAEANTVYGWSHTQTIPLMKSLPIEWVIILREKIEKERRVNELPMNQLIPREKRSLAYSTNGCMPSENRKIHEYKYSTLWAAGSTIPLLNMKWSDNIYATRNSPPMYWGVR